MIQCYQGYNSSNHCNICQSKDSNYCSHVEKSVDKKYQNDCPQTCLDGECYIPGSQTKCELNGCYGNGNCNKTTNLCSCLPNYLPSLCMNRA